MSVEADAEPQLEMKTVLDGATSIPVKGVAVEVLHGDKKQLSEECPDELKALLEKNGATEVYDKFVKGVVDEAKTRDVFGKWRDMEFQAIIDLYTADFLEKNIHVVLCKRTSGDWVKKNFRWLEFIDLTEGLGYVPQYDVSASTGSTIKTCYSTLYFPEGVAVEKLARYGNGREKLKNSCPVAVEKMITDKDAKAEYDAMIADISATGSDYWRLRGQWNLKEVNEKVKEHSKKFEKKGIAVFASHKEEWIVAGKGGYFTRHRWLEFVNRDVQPNYQPQRDTNSKDEKCAIM